MKRLAWGMTWIWIGFSLLAGSAPAEIKKYEVKSGIVHFDILKTMGEIVLRSQAVVYFDEYGKLECRETYMDGMLQEARVCDGRTLYLVMPRTKMAYKRGPASRGTELRVVLDEMGKRDDLNAGYIRPIAPMQVAGKQCQVIEVNKRDGMVARYAGFRRVLVYMRIVSSQMTMESRAVKIETGVPVPTEKFQIPPGYQIQ